MPQGEDGVCYKQGVTVKENFQQCDVTSGYLYDVSSGGVGWLTIWEQIAKLLRR